MTEYPNYCPWNRNQSLHVPNACSNTAHRRAGGIGCHPGQRIDGGHLDGAVGQGDAKNGVVAEANDKEKNQES